jgi:hypothetical protein
VDCSSICDRWHFCTQNRSGVRNFRGTGVLDAGRRTFPGTGAAITFALILVIGVMGCAAGVICVACMIGGNDLRCACDAPVFRAREFPHWPANRGYEPECKKLREEPPTETHVVM